MMRVKKHHVAIPWYMLKEVEEDSQVQKRDFLCFEFSASGQLAKESGNLDISIPGCGTKYLGKFDYLIVVHFFVKFSLYAYYVLTLIHM